jgi:hypothetical protein
MKYKYYLRDTKSPRNLENFVNLPKISGNATIVGDIFEVKM